jgi:hypothetical protein
LVVIVVSLNPQGVSYLAISSPSDAMSGMACDCGETFADSL